jgi:hypothetical protein
MIAEAFELIDVALRDGVIVHCGVHGGQTTTGLPFMAMTTVESMSSAIPDASFPMMLAVAERSGSNQLFWLRKYAAHPDNRFPRTYPYRPCFLSVSAGQRRDEFHRRFCHDRMHGYSAFCQLVCDVRRLVRGDASGYAQYNLFHCSFLLPLIVASAMARAISCLVSNLWRGCFLSIR